MTEAQKLVEQIKQTNMAELIKSMDADTRTALVAEMASQDVLTVDADEFTDEHLLKGPPKIVKGE